MKRLKKLMAYILCIVMLMGICTPVQAEENTTIYTTESGLSYVIDENDEITITGYNGASSHMIIPEYIEGRPVVTIGARAFESNLVIETVELPNTLKLLEKLSFWGCKNLLEIEIPSSVELIRTSSFQACNSLRKIVIYKDTELEYGTDANRIFSSYTRNVFRIYGYKDSPAEAYAKAFNDPFVYHDWIPLTSITLPDEITINLNERTEIPVIYGPEDSYVGFNKIDLYSFTGPAMATLEKTNDGRIFVTGTQEGQDQLYVIKKAEYNYIDNDIKSNVCKINFADPLKINANTILFKDSNNKVINDTTLSFDTYVENNECEITLETEPVNATEPITFTSTSDRLAKVEIRDGKYILTVYKGYVSGTQTATITATGSRSGVTASFNVDVSYSGASSVNFNTSFNSGRGNRIDQYSEYEMPLVVVPSNLTQDTIINIVNNPDKAGEEVITYDKTSGVLKASGVGTATITATCKGQSISYDFEVIPYEKKATSVTINTNEKVLKTNTGYSLNLKIGDSYQLFATVTPEDTTDIFKWSTVSNNEIISLDKSGNIVALKAGTATVKASSCSYLEEIIANATSEYLTITVTDPNEVKEPTTPAEIKAQSIQFNQTTGELKNGETFQIIPTIVPSNTTDTLSYRSNRPNVATVSKTGLVTAVGAGSAWIIGEINGYEAYYIVEVQENVINPTISLSDSAITIKKGDKKVIKATRGENTKEPYWSSQNEKVAKITSDGLITAVGKGSTYIEAIAYSNDNSLHTKAYCKITVTDDSTTTDSGKNDNGTDNGNKKNPEEERKPGIIKLNATKFNLQKGKTTKALAIKSSTYSDDPIVSVTSSDNKILKASLKGNTITLKGVKTSNKYVTVKVVTKSGATATCKIKVVKSKVSTSKLKLNKKNINLKKGKSTTLVVTQTPISATDKLTWTSSNKKIATVNKKGKIVAKKKGSCVISVKSSNGKKVTCKVKVK
ncbi:MAG: Ig-like domain-containing protein [Candidatus Galacturonibacter soehngenii]|nr:Ig-like domain-containing protein [Candidatus Galacturonibacter soehngenii]